MKVLISVILIIGVIGEISAQSTEFTYQGSLNSSGGPASGNFDFEFVLFDDAVVGTPASGTLTKTNVVVTNGIFSVKLDFGAGPFAPFAVRYLEIRVRPAGGGGYTTLAPRPALTSAPYAILSQNANNAANATQLGGISASGFIQNSALQQPSSTFNISGTGTVNRMIVNENAYIAGNVGIGTAAPQQTLHVIGSEILSTGNGSGFKFRDRGSSTSADDWVWYSNGNVARFFRAGVGDLIGIQTNGNVGIGTVSPSEKLSVNGRVQSTTGGFRFPDGSVQTAAANTTFTKVRNSSVPIEIIGGGGSGGWSSVALMTVPAGVYLVSATVEFRNNANFVGQNNTRRVTCGPSGASEIYSSDLAGLSRLTTTFQWIATASAFPDNISVFCNHNGDFTNQFQAAATRITAVKIEGSVTVVP
jgi:hypothetical protein